MTAPRAERDPQGQSIKGRLLLVCRANVCRSALAEFVATDRFAGTGLVVSSAGTDAAKGRHLCSEVEKFISGQPGGAEFAKRHRSMSLSAAKPGNADLILTTSPRERSRVALLQPSLRDRTFTLIEVERLLSRLPIEGPRPTKLMELTDLLHERRWIATNENWRGRSPRWQRLDLRRPATSSTIHDAHETTRTSHPRLLTFVQSLVGGISDEMLARMGDQTLQQDSAPPDDLGTEENTLHAI